MGLWPERHHGHHGQKQQEELVETDQKASVEERAVQQAIESLEAIDVPAHISEDRMLMSLQSTLDSALESEQKGTAEGTQAAKAKATAIKNIEQALTARIL